MLISRFPTWECRPIVMRAYGPPVAPVVDAAHRSACDRSDHTSNRGIARDLPRSSEERRPGCGVDKLVSSPPRCQRPTMMQLAERQSAVVRSERGAAIRSTRIKGIKVIKEEHAERFARRALHTEVTQEGFGFRHLALSRSGQPPLDAPAQPAAVLRSSRSEPSHSPTEADQVNHSECHVGMWGRTVEHPLSSVWWQGHSGQAGVSAPPRASVCGRKNVSTCMCLISKILYSFTCWVNSHE